MKATELRIGDLVFFKGTPVKVSHIDPPYLYASDGKDISVGSHENRNIFDPIPLTSEILEKNGWMGNNETRYKSFLTAQFQYNKENLIDIEVDNGEYYTCTIAKIKYIHELQHLLWALGMDDDLKI